MSIVDSRSEQKGTPFQLRFRPSCSQCVSRSKSKTSTTSLTYQPFTLFAFCVSFVKEHWPRDVLLLPNCSVVKNTYGDVVFRGPRIRIGLHWAKRPGITSRIHHVTGHRIFVGHEYDLVRQIADAGNGGQIVLTHQAWLELYPFLSQCKFPTISQIGYYTLTHSRVSQPLYDVTCCVGESYYKHFPALRRVKLVRSL